MKKPVLIGAFLASLILAVVNNLLSKHAVEWLGSPEVYPKPEGWPSLGFAKGLASGVGFAWKGFVAHAVPILLVLAVLAVAIILLNKLKSVPVSSMVRSALRLGLGAMFLAAAYPKFTDPKGFAILVAQYQFLPGPLVNAFALWLSSFEIVVGLGIIWAAWEKEFSFLVGVLLLMFIVALGQALARDLGIACGCFDIEGATDASETWFSFVRDVVLLLPVAWMIMTGGSRYLWQPKNR